MYYQQTPLTLTHTLSSSTPSTLSTPLHQIQPIVTRPRPLSVFPSLSTPHQSPWSRTSFVGVAFSLCVTVHSVVVADYFVGVGYRTMLSKVSREGHLFLFHMRFYSIYIYSSLNAFLTASTTITYSLIPPCIHTPWPISAVFLLRCHTNRIVHTASLTEEISALQGVLRGSVGGYRMLVGTNVAALRYMHKGGSVIYSLLNAWFKALSILLNPFAQLTRQHMHLSFIYPMIIMRCFLSYDFRLL